LSPNFARVGIIDAFAPARNIIDPSRMKRALVIGGGVSGLVAARGLAENGREVTLLEAKERLGGRILTREVEGAIAELGAEFVHGRSQAMMEVLRESGMKLIDVSECNRLVKGSQLKEVDLWELVGEVIGKIDAHSKDASFADWLTKTEFDPETKQMALAFVEGFNASDARVIGAHALLRAEYSSEHSEGDQQGRLREGYSALVNALHLQAMERGVKFELNARVRSVKWRRGRVEIKTETGRAFEADAAIVTLPLGVLKSGRIVFEPSLVHKQDAIAGMQFGNVAKLVFVFRAAWWTQSKALEKNFGFVHAFEEPIPTWWSDSRGPVLIGWAAGPKGDAMLNLPQSELKRRGLEIAARIFSFPISPIEKELVSIELYDWRSDPDIGGAYSYLPVNGLDLLKILAAPVENTLYFAGEATATDAQMGTVSGAIESGLRVVKEVAEQSG
jgi:monoamine oxidase